MFTTEKVSSRGWHTFQFLYEEPTERTSVLSSFIFINEHPGFQSVVWCVVAVDLMKLRREARNCRYVLSTYM